MCGIAGFLSRDPNGPFDHARSLLESMGDALVHRGPDDRAYWLDSEARVGFTHTRLAILDLSNDGAQPMVSHSGRSVIVFNGEIYNFRELRDALARDGYPFRTRSDTEVILALYEKEGLSCFARLRGMFALAIWDSQERRAVLARDGLGIKPLYLCEREGRLWFASELRALLASGQIDRALDPAAVAGFFLTGSVPEPLTPIASVTMAPPGTIVTWRDGRVAHHRFWEPRVDRRLAVDRDPVQATREALESTVRAHLVSDVPVALLLSGGMDSTALLALMQRLGLADGLKSFSIGVDDRGLDEGRTASRIAADFGVEHTVIRMDAGVACSLVDEYFDALDSPSVDGFNTWLVTRILRREGFKVALSGLGGDELFGGYPGFWRLPRIRQIFRVVQRVPGLARLSSALTRPFLRSGRGARMRDMMRSDASIPALYTSFRGLFSRDEARILAAHFSGVAADSVRLPGVVTEHDDANALDQISLLELGLYMRNQLLRDTDITSMSHGVELRVPFVDTMLIDTLLSIPSEQRILRGKRLLHEAVPEIPDFVAHAPKRGFTLPFSKWLGEGLPPGLTATRQRVPVDTPQWYQRWAIEAFERWRRNVGFA